MAHVIEEVVADFRSDNTSGCSPEILEAMLRANEGRVSSYGADPYTANVRERCREIFETDLEILPVATGTGANALAIAAMTPPWGAVFCHDHAHINRDECCAPEFFTGGAKLITMLGADGKLQADEVERVVRDVRESGRGAIPACVSVTNATEAGTIYRGAELRAIRSASHDLPIHMDGARFANALVSSGDSPADATWRAGVDILTFGATKNGANNAELMVVFRKELMPELRLRHHRSGHRLSKMRFLSAQLDAYLSNDLWLRNARHANAMALRLSDALRGAGIEIVRAVEANVVFPRLPRELASSLQQQGFRFHEWTLFGADVYRLVTAFNTTEAEVDAFAAAVSGIRT